jgi:transcription initiation factor IIE alpha subunit
MRKIVKLTETDLIRIVKKVVNEEKESTDSYYSKGPQTPHQVAKK